MKRRILVINPNSNEDVTRCIDAALDALRYDDGFAIECVTLAEGPPGIETQNHVDEVAPLVSRRIQRESASADAFVIACYSDPGLRSAREVTDRPVFGIAESGLSMALSLGDRIGVISILAQSAARHTIYARSLLLERRIAADLPIGLGISELHDSSQVADRMLQVGRELKDAHAADVVLLGCAGMANHRERLERELRIPVVEPTQATVALAMTAVRLGYRHAYGTPRASPEGRRSTR